MKNSILVVDSDHAGRDDMVEQLNRADLHAIGTTDGTRALALASECEVGLLIADLDTPDMCLLELLVGVRQLHPNTHTIIITSDVEQRFVRGLRPFGVCDHVERPVDVRALMNRAGVALGRGWHPAAASRDDPGYLIDVLHACEENELDDELVVRDGDRYGRLFYCGGKVSWVTASGEDGFLGELFDIVPLHRVVDLFERCTFSGENLVEVMIAEGLTDENTMWSLLSGHSARALARILAWKDLEYMLVPEAPVAYTTLLFWVEDLLQRARGLSSSSTGEVSRSGEPEPLRSLAESEPIQSPAEPPDTPSTAVAVEKGEVMGEPALGAAEALEEERAMRLQLSLDELRAVDGFRGAAVFTPTGVLLAEVTIDGATMAGFGAMARGILHKSMAATRTLDLGDGNSVHITTPGAHVLVRRPDGDEQSSARHPSRTVPPVHVMLVVDLVGNLALGKLRLEKIVQDVGWVLC